MPFIFDLYPGAGITNFSLGTPIRHIIETLNEHHSSVLYKIQFNKDNPLTDDVFIYLPNNGINFVFDSISQRLESIQLNDFSDMVLKYKSQVLIDSKTIPTFTLVYKLFGPIYPGSLTNENLYSLNYPGISFIFPIPDSFLPLKTSELPFKFNDGSTPVLSRIFIHSGNMVDDTVLTHSIHGDKYFQPVVLKASVGITLTSLNDSLLFDDTTQDVLCLIGPPDSTISKERDQMGIHKIGKDDVSAQRSNDDYFWNYFDMGIDLLFDGENHTIKKIIIHSNFLGHHEVNRYSKCNFKFENLDIDHKSTLQDVKNVMGAPLGPPVIFNLDESPFGCSSFHGYKGILFEVLKNGHIASVSLWKTN